MAVARPFHAQLNAQEENMKMNNENFNSSLGDKIRNLRAKQGITQEKLAEILSVSRESIRRWEKNEYVPPLDKLQILCSTFQVTMSYFYPENKPAKENEAPMPEDPTAVSMSEEGAEAKLSTADRSEEKQSDKRVTSNSERYVHTILIIVSVLLTMGFLLFTLITVFIGSAYFTTNTGDEVVISSGVDLPQFILSFVAMIVSLGLSIFAWINALKR